MGVEQVHEGAGEEDQPGEPAEQVRPVLGDQEKGGYREKAGQDPLGP
jgi:hypothetical protein